MQQRVSKRTILRYFRIWSLNLKASVKKSNAYKGEVVVRILRTLFILLTQLLMLSIVFGDKEAFVGWTKPEAYLVLGIWNLMNYTGYGFFGINLMKLEEKVVSGEFDFTLLKPVSSAWLSSFCDFSIYNWISSLSGLILIGYYFFVSWGNVQIINVMYGVVGLVIGFVIWYAIYLLLASFTLSDPRNGYLALAKEILGLTRYPVDIYSSSMQLVFYSVIPIAFISTVPAEMIVGTGSLSLILIGAGVGILFLRLSYWVWSRNVKKYVSAGG